MKRPASLWDVALEEYPFLFWIVVGMQFLWRWFVTVIGVTLITQIMYGDREPPQYAIYVRLGFCTIIALVWLRTSKR